MVILCLIASIFLAPGWGVSKEKPADIEFSATKQVKGSFKPSFTVIPQGACSDQKQLTAEIIASNRALDLPHAGKARCREMGVDGDLSLIEVTLDTSQGQVKMLQGVVVADGTGYLLTGACRADEFALHLSDFLAMMRNFRSKEI